MRSLSLQPTYYPDQVALLSLIRSGLDFSYYECSHISNSPNQPACVLLPEGLAGADTIINYALKPQGVAPDEIQARITEGLALLSVLHQLRLALESADAPRAEICKKLLFGRLLKIDQIISKLQSQDLAICLYMPLLFSVLSCYSFGAITRLKAFYQAHCSDPDVEKAIQIIQNYKKNHIVPALTAQQFSFFSNLRKESYAHFNQ